MQDNLKKNSKEKSNTMPCEIMPLWEPDAPASLTDDQEELKRQIYGQMNPRRRKFIDKIGYEQWDPFQEPKEPLDMRRDRTNRTLQQLISEFLHAYPNAQQDNAWKKGAMECALGIMQKDEKYQGIFDFCLWYYNLLKQERIKNEK